MNNMGIVILALAIGAIGVLAALFYYIRETNAERARWARYSDYRGGEPKSAVCPHCRKRTYSLRAIRERLCVHCGKNY